MLTLARLAVATPWLIASGLTDSDTLFNIGSAIAGSNLRR